MIGIARSVPSILERLPSRAAAIDGGEARSGRCCASWEEGEVEDGKKPGRAEPAGREASQRLWMAETLLGWVQGVQRSGAGARRSWQLKDGEADVLSLSAVRRICPVRSSEYKKRSNSRQSCDENLRLSVRPRTCRWPVEKQNGGQTHSPLASFHRHLEEPNRVLSGVKERVSDNRRSGKEGAKAHLARLLDRLEVVQHEQVRRRHLEEARRDAFLRRARARTDQLDRSPRALKRTSPGRATHLEQLSGLARDAEQQLPARHLGLARAVDDDLEALVKVVEEVDDSGKHAWLRAGRG